MFIDGSFVPANRIFHLDLKGAPPRMKYWEELIPFIRAIGATGILLEYEDMFPYSGRLGRLKSANAYTEGELLRILTLARSNNLEIIPLVQTLGHLEWILKYKEFAKYRESEQYPQVICLGDDEAVNLVLEALAQVTRVHKDIGINFFHIGGDEVFQIGMCESDKKVMEEMGWGHDQLLVHHFMRIAKYVKANVEGVRIVMWHDMLVGVSQELIKQIGLNLLVEPVVWQYAEDLDQSLNNDLWPSLAINFHYIWAASAFKGADGPSQYILNLPHYLKNHVSWMKQMNDVYEQFLQFRGVFVTGWQRNLLLVRIVCVDFKALGQHVHFTDVVDMPNHCMLHSSALSEP
ncbi:unnamed protein product [Toxocara canis]|uniref:beta-N-acetylhexosaminidase n=1 Tax=Toxocara canis TaxID=6265 RepID=A0A183TW96_TOXCA|nr:unnamed protein product [Toxocara canis]